MFPSLARHVVPVRLLILLLATLSSMVAAGPPPLAHPNVAFAAAGSVFAVARMADGSTVLGGAFQSVDGQPRYNMARLAPDGSLDPGFVAHANGTVQALLALPGGRVLVAGNFTQIDGQPYNRLALLDANGDVDPGFQANNALLNGRVYALAASADGQSVYVGGLFNASGYKYLAKFALATGQPDPNFQVAFGSGGIRALIPDGVGGLYIGGNFQDAGGNSALDNLARVVDNGNAAASVDASFMPVVGALVQALALDAGSVYAGGTFTSAGSPATTRNRLARFARAGGLLDPAWNPDANSSVWSMALTGGNLFVGGVFSTLSGQPRLRLARIDAATGVPSAGWVAEPIKGTVVYALAMTPGNLLAGGIFSSIGPTSRVSVAEFALADAAVQAQPDAAATVAQGPFAVLAHPDGSLWVGGNFISANGQPRNGLARVAADGSLDATVAPLIDGNVSALVVDSQQRVYALGQFSNVDGQPHWRIARFASDGTLDAAFTAGVSAAGFSAAVTETAMHADILYLTGNFTMVGTSGGSQEAAAHVAKLDTVTGLFDTAWTPVIPVPAGKFPTQTLALDPDNDALFIGGGFTSVDGLPRLGVAKLSMATGEVDPGFVADVDQLAAGQPGDVWSLAYASGHLYIGGYQFSSVNGTSGFDNLARVSATSGALDASWDAGLPTWAYVETLTVESPTRLLAAGGGVRPDGGAVARYRLDATDVIDTAFVPDLNGDGFSVVYRAADEAALVSGNFDFAEGEARAGLAAFKTENFVFADGFEN